MNQSTKTQQPAAKPLVAVEVTVEGLYYGAGHDGVGNRPPAKPYEVKMLLPPDWNRGGKGLTHVHRILSGEITGTPFLRQYTVKGKQPYADYVAKKTVTVTDWQDVFDEARAGEIVAKADPDNMAIDQLKAELTKLGITYPNPARKTELAEILKVARHGPAKVDDGRPDFGGGEVGIVLNRVPANGEVQLGVMYDANTLDPRTGLPQQGSVTLEPDGTVTGFVQ